MIFSRQSTRLAFAYAAALTGIALAPTSQAYAQSTPAPASCAQRYHGEWGIRCLPNGWGEGTFAPELVQGGSTANVAPVNRFCREITLGRPFTAVTPAAGSAVCYQFVVNEAAPASFQLLLPTGISATAELSMGRSNGQGFTLARAKTTDGGLLSGSVAPIRFSRIFLTLRTANGTGGLPAPLVFNGTLPSPFPASNTIATATRVDLNEELKTTLAGPLDEAYHFFPLGVGETTAVLSSTFASMNQNVSYFQAEETAPGTFNLGPELGVPASYAAGQQLTLTSTYPANVAGGTTTAGFLVKVKGINSGAPANQPYALRIGSAKVVFADLSIDNTESISRWYPEFPPQLEAANYVTTKIGVKDINGFWVKNQPVTLKVQRDFFNDNTIQEVTGLKTNAEGKASTNALLPATGLPGIALTTNFTACTGGVMTELDYGPPGVPRDHWDGTAQQGTVTIALPGSSPATQTSLNFIRICSETYRGYK